MSFDSCLVDTNVLLRIPNRADTRHQSVDAALSKLAVQGTALYYTHQNIAEFWNAMTRPQERNGFGLTAQDADREVALIEAGMELLPDMRRPIGSGEESLCNTTSPACRFTMPVLPPLCMPTELPISSPSMAATSSVSAD